ncbi:MAG: DNA mismatch repair endonuclease MutL [Verrucomicrobia subdivision 3 bacterium]|nr:DNA mismatch repair endonuclease MutL [Limisphaerales bacterium]
MNRIRLLPEHVANQIAAGEVVERPASVVKELVENSIDAEARHIAVEIQAGGRSLIRVADDGVGMSRDDALLCLERHATSKIQRAEDLSAIATMGFRGEAIPSIASVCRMVLTSRERGSDPAATQIIINGGKLVEVRAAGSPAGTSVEVRQLFFNLPARRKFLRSDETEYAHIHHYLTLAALAHPQVGFTITKDGRAVWQLPAVAGGEAAPQAGLRERMRALFANEGELLPVDFSASIPPPRAAEPEDDANTHFRVWGLIGKPGVSRATRDEQFIFVNRRPVENRGINFALAEGYHTALMKGRYPVCCLFLEIDPAAVDVNIHPAKREVKFHQERAVRQHVTDAIRETLLSFHTAKLALPATSSGGSRAPGTAVTSPSRSGDFARHPPAPVDKPVEFPQFTSLTGTALDPRGVAPERITGRSEVAQPPLPPPAPVRAMPDRADAAPSPIEPQPVPLLQVPLRILGVIGHLYVVLESDKGLVLMDQHAAHERILFEQMLQRLERGSAPSQRLLLAETVELSVRDAQFVRELLPTLNRLGVGLSEFGERTFLLDALPPFVKVGDARRFTLGLIDELKAAGQEVNTLRLGEHTVAKTVCRHAVKANDPLSGPELESLLKELRHCAMPYTCPHGRPTLIEMNYRELEKKFGRVGSA